MNLSIDVRGRTQCLHVNLYGPQLLYSSCKFGQVILTRTVYMVTRTHDSLASSSILAPQHVHDRLGLCT